MEKCCAICNYCKEIYNGEYRYNSIWCEKHKLSFNSNRLDNVCEDYKKEI